MALASLLLGFVATSLSMPAASEAAGARSSACLPRSAKTVLANRHVVVYTIRNPRTRATYAYACSRGSGKRYLIRRRFSPEDDPLLAYELAGSFVAIRSFGCPRQGDCEGRLDVLDSRRGRKLFNLSRGRAVSDVALKSNGSIAWVETTSGGLGPYLVKKLDGGGETLLDTVSEKDSRSLALSESTLYWMSAGEARTSQLP